MDFLTAPAECAISAVSKTLVPARPDPHHPARLDLADLTPAANAG